MALSPQPHLSVAGNFSSRPCTSDLLQSSCNGVFGVLLRVPGSVQCVTKKRVFAVSSKLRKVKKHERPWPEDPDPNVRGGVLSHLSFFKPLKVKPKPVTLDFEKPLMDLQKKIIDVQRMANETGLDFSDQIISLENKYQQALKDLYTHLTPIQRVNIARHPNRPTFLDHVFNITDTFVELHGDRAGYDDPAVVTGLGSINGKPYMFIGHQKGRNTKENIQRNFGMPTPHGYRKALRMMYYADHHGFPIVTFIDTPGAYADLKSEELGQGEAIAHNLRTMFGLKVPIISIVMGEGGSGGALAIGCGNKLLMLENAVFYVASPEACAAILWKSAKASPKAAEKLKITATELSKLQICDGIIPEPLGGAHADPHWTSQQIKKAILEGMDELQKMDTKELLAHRAHKFRKLGGFQEGIPQEPAKKVNMKKKERLVDPPISDAELKDDVEKLKQEVLKAMKTSADTSDSSSKTKIIEKLQKEIGIEYSTALAALGLEAEIVKLREEASKAKNSKDLQPDPVLEGKIHKLTQEFMHKLPTAPNYNALKSKFELLKELVDSQKVTEKSSKANELKQEINKKYKELINQPHVKDKFEALKAEIDKNGTISEETKEKIFLLKSEVQQELAAALESLGLRVNRLNPPSLADAMAKLEAFDKQVHDVMEDITNSTDLKDKIELLKVEIAKAGETPNAESKAKIEALDQEIKHGLAKALSLPELKQKYEQLVAEISEAAKYSGGSNGSVKHENDSLIPDGLKLEEIQVGTDSN